MIIKKTNSNPQLLYTILVGNKNVYLKFPDSVSQHKGNSTLLKAELETTRVSWEN